MVLTVNFNDYNSYSYFNFILYDYTISNAVRKTRFISIPGRNGDLDLTDYFGEVYEDRNIDMIFYTKRSIGGYWRNRTVHIGTTLNVWIGSNQMEAKISI